MKRLNKVLFTFLIINILVFSQLISTFAAINHQYSVTQIRNSNHRGLRGDFKLPSIDSKYSSTYNTNFITFEEWMSVNNSYDWYELGYMDGSYSSTGYSPFSYYKGFYKAKSINGTYVESKVTAVTATVGSRYKLEISDTNMDNIWNIYIGSTYVMAFSETVSATAGGHNDQGYEVQYDTLTAPQLSATDITNTYYYALDGDDFDKDGNTTEWIWKPLYNRGVTISDSTHPNGIYCSYSSSTNTTTFTKN